MSLLDQVLEQEERNREVEILLSIPKVGEPYVVYTTRRGAMLLNDLRIDEVKELYQAGNLTDEELTTWAGRRNLLGIQYKPMRKPDGRR
jgi:hypothetical protein